GRELAGELRPRMLAPDQVLERPRLQFHGRIKGADLQWLLLSPLSGREMLDFLIFGRPLRRGGRRRALDARLFADLGFDLACELGVFLQVVARVVLALPQ